MSARETFIVEEKIEQQAKLREGTVHPTWNNYCV
jgi:hypothetical protein